LLAVAAVALIPLTVVAGGKVAVAALAVIELARHPLIQLCHMLLLWVLAAQAARLLEQMALLAVILFLIPSLQLAAVTARVHPEQAQPMVEMAVLAAVLLVDSVVQEQAVQGIHQAQAQAKVIMAVLQDMPQQVEAVVLQEVALVP
jgi:hypothetical protein